jgi:hypothetical protein
VSGADRSLHDDGALPASYVVDVADLPWRPGETEGITFRGQIALSGDDGGPEAFRFQFDPCPAVYAHLHLVSQFQFLLGGAMDLPRDSMKLRALAVHYTDHARPYGPFSVSGPHDVLVLHPRKGGLVSMADRTARRRISLGGREAAGIANTLDWRPVVAAPGLRAKVLIGIPGGPSAILLEVPPGCPVPPRAAPYGRYEVVIRGSMVLDGCEIGPPGLRFVRGDQTPSPAEAGASGATVALLTFDRDALEGGLGGDDFSTAAEQAMSRAI